MSDTVPTASPSQSVDPAATATDAAGVAPSTSAAAQQPVNGGVSGSPLQGNPTQNSSPGGLSQAGKVGLGVGIGVGVLVIAAVIAIIFILLRRRREKRLGPYGSLEHQLEKEGSQVSHARTYESMPTGEAPYAPVPEVRSVPRRNPLEDVPYIHPPVPRNRLSLQTPANASARMSATTTRPPLGPDASPSTFTEMPPTRHSMIDTMKPMPMIPPPEEEPARQPSPVSPMSPVSPLGSRSSSFRR